MFPVATAVNLNAETKSKTAGHTDKISFLFDFEKGDFVVEDGKVKRCTGDEALVVWIQKICRTEKNRYRVYDDTPYGVIIEDLITGARYSPDFVKSELRRELEDALLQNEQITGISSFECSQEKSKLIAKVEIATIRNKILSQEVVYDG